jgi:hypothetical protein
MSKESVRSSGWPEGVTEFVEMRERSVFEDGGVVDADAERIRNGRLADRGMRDSLAGLGKQTGGLPQQLRSWQREAGMTEVRRFFRDVRVEAGPWVDLDAAPAEPVEGPVTYVAQAPIVAGQLVIHRDVTAEDEIGLRWGHPSVPVWPLTPDAAAQGFEPFGMSAHRASPGDIVDVRELTGVEPTAGEAAPPVMTETKALSSEASLAFAERRHMGRLLTWDDLDALRQAGERALADLPPGFDDGGGGLSALRQALGKIDLGRTHGYEAAES